LPTGAGQLGGELADRAELGLWVATGLLQVGGEVADERADPP
jgi:hypothetical protein